MLGQTLQSVLEWAVNLKPVPSFAIGFTFVFVRSLEIVDPHSIRLIR